MKKYRVIPMSGTYSTGHYKVEKLILFGLVWIPISNWFSNRESALKWIDETLNPEYYNPKNER